MAKGRKKERDPYRDGDWLEELAAAAEAAFKLRKRGSVVRPTCLCDGCVLIQMRDWNVFETAIKELTGWRGYIG